MTLVQEIKHDYQCGRITYDDMADAVKDIQKRCKHISTTVSIKFGTWEEFCDECGKRIEE